ncbi:hypothetical protein BU23DRAFT_636550 [Bimuria novae-zelandiae CBS 107.79]|uniref:TPR-like protein n=1 Tax=Bimuria novae-zelandiae CBS 107.79 TaxID=1447943 RepID=A0A6A5VSF2_9PLEO|nr:hypothetical protein BU23DRAFT_636550 [Bimuria novae-zelandiae CBS 107.79]
MADPVSLLAAGIGMSDVAFRVIKYLMDVKAASKIIEGDIESLINEVEGLMAIHHELEKEFYENVRNGVLGRKETMLWFNIGQTLKNGQKLTLKLEACVRQIYGDNPSVTGKRNALIKQHRRRNNSSVIGGVIRVVPPPAPRRTTLTTEGTSLGLLQHGRNINVHFDIPKPVDQCYTGRDKQAKQLKEWILGGKRQGNSSSRKDTSIKHKRFVIYGLSGSGKTQFCSKFAVDCREDFWGVFWVDGSSRERLKQTFAQNISRMEMVDMSEYAALHWLSSQVQPWLLIIDNADDADVALEDYFPRGDYGHILITTRDPMQRSYGTVGDRFFEFQGLANDEATCLLLKTAAMEQPWKPIDIKTAQNIAETLGYLPLAIIHAGRTVREGFCKLHSYLKYYDYQWQNTQRKRLKLNYDHVGIFATLEIAHAAIKNGTDETSQDALQLLNTFAFLYNQNIHFDILIKAVQFAERERTHQEVEIREEKMREGGTRPTWPALAKNALIFLLNQNGQSPPVLPSVVRDGRTSKDFDWYRLRARAALRKLEQFSLVTHIKRIDSYSLHPFVHKWARERPDMTIAEQSVWCGAAATLVSHCILLPPLGNTVEDEEIRRYLLPHVDHIRACQDSIDRRMQDLRFGRTKAFPGWWEPTFNREKAFMYAKFSTVYAQNGRWEEAKKLQLAVRDFTVEVYGMGHAATRSITLALAFTLQQLGELGDASSLQEGVLHASLTHVGAVSLEALTTKSKLGSSRRLQGRYHEARKLLQEATEDLEKHYGPIHEDTIDAKDELGLCIMAFGTVNSVKEARKLHIEAIDGMARVHGSHHLRTLKACENLCLTAVESGRQSQLAEAHKMMAEVLQLRKEKLGKEHGLTILGMINLSRVKGALADLEGVENLLQEALLLGERNYGPDHALVLWGRCLLAKTWAQQTRWLEAEQLLIAVTESQRTALQGAGKYHPDRLAALVELTAVYDALGRIEDCTKLADEALDGFSKLGLDEHPMAKRMRRMRSGA